MYVTALQAKLGEEKNARQKAEVVSQEKERQMSMLSVDYRQIQQRLQKLEGEHRQEVEKVGKHIYKCIMKEFIFTSFQRICLFGFFFFQRYRVKHCKFKLNKK